MIWFLRACLHGAVRMLQWKLLISITKPFWTLGWAQTSGCLLARSWAGQAWDSFGLTDVQPHKRSASPKLHKKSGFPGLGTGKRLSYSGRGGRPAWWVDSSVPATPPMAFKADDSSQKSAPTSLHPYSLGRQGCYISASLQNSWGRLPEVCSLTPFPDAAFELLQLLQKQKRPTPACAFYVVSISFIYPAVNKKVPNWWLCYCTTFLHTTMQKCSNVTKPCSSLITSPSPLTKQNHFWISCSSTQQSPG